MINIRLIIITIIYYLIAGQTIFAREATLEATLKFKNINGFTVPIQNNIPLPSFEKQKRTIINLEGKWKKQRFYADDNISLNKRDEEGYNKLIEEGQERFKPDYNDSLWEDKYLPSVENKMNECEKRPEYYEDGVWYRRHFTIKNPGGKRAVLKFHSVNYVADIWINGNYAGYHEGGYTPFAFDITPFIKSGDNLIAVRVDNPEWGKRNDIVPYTKADWFNYTGIIQDVYIEFLPEISISRVDIIPKSTNGDVIIKPLLWNPKKKQTQVKLVFSVYNTDIKEENISSEYASHIIGKKIDYKGTKEINFSIENNIIPGINKIKITSPKLWTPAHPCLYVLKAELKSGDKILDEFYTEFGIRTMETKGNKFLLNKEPSFFTSLARHEDHPLYGRAIPKNIIYNDLKMIHSLNATMMRTAHYPNNLFTYILADRIGIAVIEEIPVWWFDEEDPWKIQNKKRHIHQQMWREMIFKDYNRPSIFLWSAANECRDVINRKIFIETIHKELDTVYPDGRLVTQSAAADRPGPEDASQFAVDIPGWTMYFGVFMGKDPYEDTKKFLQDIQKIHPDKPVLNTEYGRWSREDHKEENIQIKIFNNTFKALTEAGAKKEDGKLNKEGGLMAVTWWCIFDWYSHTLPDGFQSMGLYGMDRKSIKEVALILKERYKEFVKSRKGENI